MGPLPNPKHERFARLVVLGTPFASAYVQAGFQPGSDRNARAAGSRLAAQPNIVARLEELRAERDAELFETLRVDRDLVVREYLRIALAKPSDLVETEQVCCRHCHGREHLYQWRTDREFHKAHKDWSVKAERAAKRRRRPEGDEPSAEGGYGFSTPLRYRAGFHSHHRARRALEELEQRLAPELRSLDHLAPLVQPDNVEQGIAQVDAEHGRLGRCIACHGLLLPLLSPQIQAGRQGRSSH